MIVINKKELEDNLAPCPICGSKVKFTVEQVGNNCRSDIEKVIVKCSNNDCGLECSFSSVGYLRDLSFSSNTLSKNNAVYRKTADMWNKLKENSKDSDI